MKLTVVLPAIVVLGFILLVLAFVWPLAVGAESNWTMEDFQDYQQALAKGHEISHEQKNTRGGVSEDLKKRDEAIRRDVERLDTKLNAARDGARNVVRSLKWSGIGLILIGAIGMYARQASDGSS